MDTCSYGEPVLIPMELTQGREAWFSYPINTQPSALPANVLVSMRLGGLYDGIGILEGPFDSWSDIHQNAADAANSWYERGRG